MSEEDGQSEPRRSKMNTREGKPKFKDPLMNTADDSDEGELESLDLDASGKSELSVSRSSSLIANLSGYDDDENAGNDMVIIVDDPEKHSGTMDSYVTFRITLKIINSLYTKYFVYFYQPLPEKHTLRRLDRFSAEFLRVRGIALQKFLTRLADHPVLSFDKNFQIFLTAKAWEFQAHKKQSTGLLGRVSDSIHNMGASYMMKNRIPEFTIMHEYMQAFGEKLASIDRITQRIVKEQTDFHTDLLEWGPIYTLWANSEDQLVNALLTMSKTVDVCSEALKDLIDATDDNFSQPLKEYILYSEAIKAVLRRRDAIQSQYEETLDELNKRKDEREQLKISDQTYSLGAFLGKDPDEVKQQKQDKLDQQITDLTAQMERLNDKSVVADSDLRADMERWHKNKHKDMKEIFIEMADRNLHYYEKCLKSWEDAIRAIQCRELETTSCDTKDEDKDEVSLKHTESTETDKTASDLS
ncbi:sorting nexin-30-like [Mercenaria mercenaria]|uniref:sorting nexin-30-like n=1 Tax=Mercenaria mercenaria TaxID=6596 RepID=UPI00234ECCE0|nr:sorting nexin-30-like [Mercenaria mercenaria]